MTIETLYQQTPELKTVIQKLEKEGWEFQIDEWENGHNGNDEWNFQFKSPRMREFSTTYDYDKPSIQTFRKREADVLAYEFTESCDDTVHDQLRKVFREVFLSDPKIRKPEKITIKIKI